MLLLDLLFGLQGADSLADPLLLLVVGKLIAAIIRLLFGFRRSRQRHLKFSPFGVQAASSISKAEQLFLHRFLGLQQS